MNKRSISLEEYSLEINRRGGRRLDADCRAFPDGNGSSPGKRAFLPFFLPPFHLLFRFLALPHTPSGRIRQRPTVLHRIVHRNAGSNGGQTAAGSSHAGASTSPSHPGAGNSQSNKPSGDSAISSGTTGNTAGSSSSGQTTTTTTGPTTTSPSVTPSGKIIAGYYAGWSSYKGYTPDKIPANRLTHLHYAFAKTDPSANAVALADPSNDRKNFAALRKLKQRQPRLENPHLHRRLGLFHLFFRRILLSGAEGSLRPELPGIYSGTRLRRHRSGLGISRFGRIGGKHQPAAG